MKVSILEFLTTFRAPLPAAPTWRRLRRVVGALEALDAAAVADEWLNTKLLHDS